MGIKQKPCHCFEETMNYLGETFAEMLECFSVSRYHFYYCGYN